MLTALSPLVASASPLEVYHGPSLIQQSKTCKFLFISTFTAFGLSCLKKEEIKWRAPKRESPAKCMRAMSSVASVGHGALDYSLDSPASAKPFIRRRQIEGEPYPGLRPRRPRFWLPNHVVPVAIKSCATRRGLPKSTRNRPPRGRGTE